MDWLMLANLIIKVGLPTAEKIWQKWQAGGEPSLADWQELKDMAGLTPTSIMQNALLSNGIDLNSDRAKELLALLKPKV